MGVAVLPIKDGKAESVVRAAGVLVRGHQSLRWGPLPGSLSSIRKALTEEDLS